MKKIWLYYVSYPATTAVYFEKAFRKKYDVTTIGPQLPSEYITKWKLENLKQPILPQDIPTDFEPDILQIFNDTPPYKQPEVFIWIESVGRIIPRNTNSLPIPTACYLIDSHLHLQNHIELAKNFDFVFIAQKEYLKDFINAGNEKVFWLPLGADPETHDKFSETRIHDVGFVGSLIGNQRRVQLLEYLKSNFDFYYERAFLKEMSKIFSESKIVFNNAVRNDLNMRFFEAMSTGSLLLSDKTTNSGQRELFVENEDYALYEEDVNIGNVVNFYLENDELREAIAKRGMELVRNAHKYSDRAEDMLAVISGEKNSTLTAEELREKSVKFTSVKTSMINKLKRSFVIPVIDYAPASQYNIKTLLDDLEKIEGEVIVVFNSEEVANEIKDDPRIDYYAVMKKNVGVARAWNIGLNIARTPIVFIVNSDVHVEKSAIIDFEQALISQPNAAMVGPQGSFFHFDKLADLHYFDKNKFDQIQEVDAVSGFLFGVRKKYFDENNLKFENAFTPCYFEEWDIGLQIKRAGLASYIVPSFDYDHEWSGSIRSMRKISYYDKSETAVEIHARNSDILKKKWEKIVEKDNSLKRLLISGWVNWALFLSKQAIEMQNFEPAEKIFKQIIELYPELEVGYKNLGFLYFIEKKFDIALPLLKKAGELNPDDEAVKTYLEKTKSEIESRLKN